MKFKRLHYGDYGWRIEPKGVGLCLAYNERALRYDVLLKCHPLADDGKTILFDKPHVYPHFESVDLGDIEEYRTITDHLKSQSTKGLFINHGPERGVGEYSSRLSGEKDSGFKLFESRRSFDSTYMFFKHSLGELFDESKWA